MYASHETDDVGPHATPLRNSFQLTSRTFTKPRSRAKHGGGVSTPTEICYFHHLRGKRPKAALREMALLGAVTRPLGLSRITWRSCER